MAWPTTPVATTNLDSALDNPANARTDLLEAVNAVNSMMTAKNTASGVAGLDSSSKIATAQIPNTISSSSGTDLDLTPHTGRVSITSLVNLNPRSVTQLAATSGVIGDVAFCEDGDAGAACLAVYNGSNWVVISLGANIAIA